MVDQDKVKAKRKALKPSKKSDAPESQLSTKGLCDLLAVDRSTVFRWIKAGLPHTKKPSGNVFNSKDVYAWLESHPESTAIGRPRGPLQEEIQKAQLRRLLAKADLDEMTSANRKKELVAVADVEAANLKKFSIIREKFLQLPASIAPSLLNLEASEIEATIETAIADVLTELSKA